MTSELVGCPECGAVARAKDRRPTWAGSAGGRAAGGDLLAQADLVLCASGVPGEDVDGSTSGDQAAGVLDRASPGLSF
jgi:hypothetical protein